jgi:hypothetical protein
LAHNQISSPAQHKIYLRFFKAGQQQRKKSFDSKKKKNKKEESQTKVDPGKDELQTFGKTLKTATVNYTKITLLQHLCTPIISFFGVCGCKGGCF